MAKCSICGQWAGVASSLHEECERAVAEGRESPRMAESRDLLGKELRAGASAVKSANAAAVFAGILILPVALIFGFAGGHFGTGDDAVMGFFIGAGAGGVLAVMNYLKTYSAALDMKRRQMYMDRR